MAIAADGLEGLRSYGRYDFDIRDLAAAGVRAEFPRGRPKPRAAGSTAQTWWLPSQSLRYMPTDSGAAPYSEQAFSHSFQSVSSPRPTAFSAGVCSSV